MSRPSAEAGPAIRPAFVVRKPRVEDGAAMWDLVTRLDDLEENTLYAYLLFARDFADTCRVAEGESGIRGLVVGYRPPAEPDILFIWQVGVHPEAQRRGLAARMILDILEGGDGPPFRFLEATVAPGNDPSTKLFEGIARRRNADCAVTEGFTARHFHPQEHPPERRFRIGPFRRNA